MPIQLPYIDDYAVTTSRHPDFEAGYQQWISLVRMWGYTEAKCAEVFDECFDHIFNRDYYREMAGL